MRILDLFCGGGGAAVGMHRAFPDAEITGIDIKPMPCYPFEFIQGEALNPPVELDDFDLIWASPPCQCYSYSTVKWRNRGKEYPNLIGRTRELLSKTSRPYIMENVVGAPLRKDLMLCGEMFGLKVFRHRIFELEGFTVLQPLHRHRGRVKDGTRLTIMNGGTHACFGDREARERIRKFYTVAGHGGNGSAAYAGWCEAMGIWWMDKQELTQAIPPAYSEYICKFVEVSG